MKFSNLLPSINFKQYMIMKYPEFFQTVRELKMTISDSFLPLCYCIYISKDLKKCGKTKPYHVGHDRRVLLYSSWNV